MQSALHGMIEKARRYAEEPGRVRIEGLRLLVKGDNRDHAVSLDQGRLMCECDHFRHSGVCAHVLTADRILRAYLPANAVPYPGAEQAE